MSPASESSTWLLSCWPSCCKGILEPGARCRNLLEDFSGLVPPEQKVEFVISIPVLSENFRMRELAQIVAGVVPACKVTIADGASPDKRNYRVNCEKALTVLDGFNPCWTAAKGARELHEAYIRVGLRLEDFEVPKYQRLAHVQMLMAKGLLGNDLRPTLRPATAT